MSSTCLGQLITSYQIEHKKIKSTLSDHYAVFAKIPGMKTVPGSSDPKTIKVRKIKIPKTKTR